MMIMQRECVRSERNRCVGSLLELTSSVMFPSQGTTGARRPLDAAPDFFLFSDRAEENRRRHRWRHSMRSAACNPLPCNGVFGQFQGMMVTLKNLVVILNPSNRPCKSFRRQKCATMAHI